jgi:putative nucleotidyltransferase with HDIG domain
MPEYRLLELSSPTSPLLQRLLMDAPGTYQHSLVISNLVEQAVKRIGGNPLLARVGALYHDVGKLKRPQFFTENQVSGDNPHDRISPHLSYLIITAHVREGLELLRDYGLPADLEAFVAEHHGTTVLSYFSKRALEESSGLDELNFRYPGPRPRSRETAVLMLADAVESASRSLQEPNQGSIRALIDRLVEQRLQDGQLAESQLNLTDIEEIKDTFERMLTAIMHRRVAYPSAEEIGRLQRSTDRSPEPLASRAASS